MWTRKCPYWWLLCFSTSGCALVLVLSNGMLIHWGYGELEDNVYIAVYAINLFVTYFHKLWIERRL